MPGNYSCYETHRRRRRMPYQNDHQDALSQCIAYPCVEGSHVRSLSGGDSKWVEHAFGGCIRAAGCGGPPLTTSDRFACHRERMQGTKVGERAGYEGSCIGRSRCTVFYWFVWPGPPPAVFENVMLAIDSSPTNSHRNGRGLVLPFQSLRDHECLSEHQFTGCDLVDSEAHAAHDATNYDPTLGE